MKRVARHLSSKLEKNSDSIRVVQIQSAINYVKRFHDSTVAMNSMPNITIPDIVANTKTYNDQCRRKLSVLISKYGTSCHQINDNIGLNISKIRDYYLSLLKEMIND